MVYRKVTARASSREVLRSKGQFWTPEWVARAMVAYALGGGSHHILDPAVGEGAFFRAAKAIRQDKNGVKLIGTEIDPFVVRQAMRTGLTETDLADVEIRDFVLDPPDKTFSAIVGNPPYIRHHRLSADTKLELRRIGTEIVGEALDGRAGLHVYFLLRALQMLRPEGRLAFILPADVCEGVFAGPLWRWITRGYRVDAVVTFAPDSSPFPDVDVNPIIVMLRNTQPAPLLLWAVCTQAGGTELESWVMSGFGLSAVPALHVCERSIVEALATGFTREPREREAEDFTLGDFGVVVRGIATGANEFFFLTEHRARELCIPPRFLVPAIGRTRDVDGDEITPATMTSLAEKGRPTLLFCPDGRDKNAFPAAVRHYIDTAERMGIPERPLIKTRRPWYKMETRRVPPILFAYLGRRNARFIRNRSDAVPLTGFLCVYPRGDDEGRTEKLWSVLRKPEVVRGLRSVGKSYGGGAIKVEPRALERLPLPASLVRSAGLTDLAPAKQTVLFRAMESGKKYRRRKGKK